MSETAGKTLGVATTLCVVCSVLVASAAVALKPLQNKNKDIDFKKNILISAGLIKPGIDIEESFKQIEALVVDLKTGEVLKDVDPETFIQDKADKDPALVEEIPKLKDVAGIKRRSKHQKVYLVKKNGEVDQIVLHVYGKGLWSTMKGFVSLDKDTVTIRGFNYYSHGETPGLGGEIDNPRWVGQWPGKKVYNEDMEPSIEVIKGLVNPKDPEADYKIDGISGATLTTDGVEGTFRYWMSEAGYGKFLENFRKGVLDEN